MEVTTSSQGSPISVTATYGMGTLSIKLHFEPQVSLINTCKEMNMIAIKNQANQVLDDEGFTQVTNNK